MGLDAWSALLAFFNLIQTAVAAVLEPVNLSNDELLVLICLAHAGDSLSMGEIERSTLFQAERLRRAVDKLEERRLITWRRSQADRRKVLVRKTKAGRQLIESLSPVMFDVVRRVAEPVGQESTEFMRAKMRKILSSTAVDTAVDLAGMYADHHSDGPLPQAPGEASEPAVRSAQRPLTWGLAGWLRCCQWSGHVDRLWRVKFANLGVTQQRFQVLAALSDAGEGPTVEAVASTTGLPRPIILSNLSWLERAGLAISCGASATGDRTARQTPKGAYLMLEAMPMANSLAEDLYRGLGDEDLERVLELVRKACGAAWQVDRHYCATRRLPSTTPAQ
jgi:DNA-binding MarR family transcriptional regulator